MGRRPLPAAVACSLVAIPIFPIPGLAGRSISVGGVARTSTGGAIIAATENAGTSTQRVAIARLNVDGTVDLAYGARGITQAGLGAGAEATAVAINPASGGAWVGVRTPSGASEIVALDGAGNRVATFGSGGVVRLARALQSGPRALAWRSGELLVAAGTSPCAGCRIAQLDASTGRTSASQQLSWSTPCPVRSVTSAVFTTSGNAMFGTTARCGAPIMALHGPQGLSVPATRATMVAGSGARLCEAEVLPGAIDVAAAGTHGVHAPAGRLIGLTSLGGGACAALIYPARSRHAVVVQTGPGSGPAASSTPLPGAIQPLAISRCNQHLLVIGDEPSGGTRRGAVAVVPVREGPHAAAAKAAARAAALRPSAATCRSA